MKVLHSIWVVDDDDVNRFLYEKLFASEPDIQPVRFFLNGHEAQMELLEMIKEGNAFPDVIFLDKDMPVMNGWEFLDWFKTLKIQQRSLTRVIMATSFLHENERIRAAKYSCLDVCVLKPVSREMLSSALQSLGSIQSEVR